MYSLTEAGEEILKRKVNVNFSKQIEFIENFLTELASIYIESVDDNFRDEETNTVLKTLEEMFDRVLQNVPTGRALNRCPNCDTEIEHSKALFCAICGAQLRADDDSE